MTATAAALNLTMIARGGAVSWVSNSSGSWNEATNWSSNPLLPGRSDDVTIAPPVSDVVVTLDSGTQQLSSLISEETIALSGTAILNAGVESYIGYNGS